MLAAWYRRNGPARDVFEYGELPLRSPGVGEVRVRVSWSGVNPSDVKSRAARPPAAERIVPHSDGMGVIDAVGQGVAAQRIGQRVWLWNAAWQRAEGTAAQWVCLPEAMAVPLPDAVPDEAGACLGIPAMTAAHAVLAGAGVAGQNVLVQGGAGAVGHYAVQLAALCGAAQVIATVSSDAKAAIARDAGADQVVNYRTGAVVDEVMALTGGAGVDRVIELDVGANLTTDVRVLRPQGQIMAYGHSPRPLELPFLEMIAKNVELRFYMVYELAADDRQRAQSLLQRLMARGLLTHLIDQRFPLSEIAAAHERVESGQAVGNVVLNVG